MKISIEKPLAIQELGSRANQEDCVFPAVGEATEDCHFFILCDGMGGHENGEVASQLVCNTLSAYLMENSTSQDVDEVFKKALEKVFDKLDEYDDDSFLKMGTTLTFVNLYRGGAMMAHIGDSRIYHIRPSERRILYKSRDHSLVYDLFVAGEVTRQEMATYSRKNVLTRALMPHQEVRPQAAITHTTDIQQGDYFFLCSDGVLEQMSDEELVDLLSQDKTDEDKCEKIRRITADNKDNHSAYLIRISDVQAEAHDESFPNDEPTTNNNSILLENQENNAHQTPADQHGWLKIVLWVVVLLMTSLLLLFFCR